MSGHRPISANTPSNMDPEVLKRIFVQREKLLEQIVDRLSRSMTTGDKHHTLLVGPRGSGKTCFVSRAAWELQQREELNSVMRIAWLGEDDSFTSLIHLAFGIANQLATEYPDEFPADFKTPVRGLPQDDAALAVLNGVIERLQDRNLILITENMDQTFRSLGDSGQKKWRAFLQETRKIATLATAQQLFAGVSDRKEAFFGFFDIQHMDPLSVEQASELIARISTEESKPDLANYLNSDEGKFRIRALHYLAGGNHRMYVLLSEFLTRDTLDDLVVAFENLAEDMTPYFQERVRSLPDQQRQLVQCLCDAEGALTVKQIAAETFIEERTCSKQLGNLRQKGYVQSEKRGKESYYDMAEPLMRLCLEVKNQRGRPLRMVARFLRAWFPATALEKSLNKTGADRVREYCAAALNAGDTFKTAITGRLAHEIENRINEGALAKAKELNRELHFADESLARTFALRLAARDAYRGDFSSAIESLSALIETADSVAERASALVLRGLVFERQGDTQLALTDYSAVAETPNAPTDLLAKALVYRGITLQHLGNIERALADYSTVIEIPDIPVDEKARALIIRGASHGLLGNREQEFADYAAVINMPNAPVDQKAKALVCRGITYELQGDSEYGLADYSAVIEMPNAPVDQKAIALVNRGVAYGQQGDSERELADYSAVIEMPNTPVDQKAPALINRGALRWQDQQFKESVDDYEAVVALSSISPDQRTGALFAVVEPMIELRSRSEIREALTRAFDEGDSQESTYGGTPQNLLSMVLRRSPTEWESYVSDIAPLFIEHRAAEKLGQGITQSIQYLDEGGFSESQIDIWNSAWQQAGDGCEELELPLRCLDAAVEIMKSDPPTDRPLFKLPLEIRGLIRPLLTQSLDAKK